MIFVNFNVVERIFFQLVAKSKSRYGAIDIPVDNIQPNLWINFHKPIKLLEKII